MTIESWSTKLATLVKRLGHMFGLQCGVRGRNLDEVPGRMCDRDDPINVCDSNGPDVQAYPPGFEDMERRMADLTRLKKLTGYAPKFNLDKIRQDVIADIRKQLVTQDRLSYTTV
jgi:hypothetical protein